MPDTCTSRFRSGCRCGHRRDLHRLVLYARAQGPVETSLAGEEAEHILEGEDEAIAAIDGNVEK